MGIEVMVKAQLEKELLQKARKICAVNNLIFTPLRESVYREILKHESVGAYEIAERLNKVQRTNVATVYRALDFLLEAGLIYKILSNKKFAATRSDGGSRVSSVNLIMICKTTGEISKLHSRALNNLLASITDEAGFDMTGATVEIEGSLRQ
jgi:Fur family transcriptional regulator, zinc uptake regulator